ncbi:hypothetical protein ACFWNT_29980 [Streptomyces sp. NPDC058409]|uniref:hypothetical protein n=1 Tax=Streptomyces sp. NPDC058409 TaxID=3346484 RepID=UPI003668420E
MFEVWAGVDLGEEHHYCVVLEGQGQRLRVQREFQPAMSAARTRQAAENADGAACADAVSEYAALQWDELRGAALKLLTGPSPAASGRG